MTNDFVFSSPPPPLFLVQHLCLPHRDRRVQRSRCRVSCDKLRDNWRVHGQSLHALGLDQSVQEGGRLGTDGHSPVRGQVDEDESRLRRAGRGVGHSLPRPLHHRRQAEPASGDHQRFARGAQRRRDSAFGAGLPAHGQVRRGVPGWMASRQQDNGRGHEQVQGVFQGREQLRGRE